jgi:hypothetical protein
MDRSEAGRPRYGGAHPPGQEADSQPRPIASPPTLPASLREGINAGGRLPSRDDSRGSSGQRRA